jgi:hypothetical protein
MTKQYLSEKLGESIFAEKLRLALKEAELKKQKKQMENANDNKERSQNSE